MRQLVCLVLFLSCVACGSDISHLDCKNNVSGERYLTYKKLSGDCDKPPQMTSLFIGEDDFIIPDSTCSTQEEPIASTCSSNIDIYCSVNGFSYDLNGEFDASGSKSATYSLCENGDCCVSTYDVTW